MGELGNTLSRARRARGITIEDAERHTHVSRRYLQALETEEFAIFPAPVYARGFLRTYSRYLGLNPQELVRVFPHGDLTPAIADGLARHPPRGIASRQPPAAGGRAAGDASVTLTISAGPAQ